MEKIIEVTVNNQPLTFSVATEDYNKYMNELMPSNKVGPARNFLVRTVTKDSKEALATLLKQPGVEIQLAAVVIDDYVPDLTIEVGKPKA